MNSYLWNLAQDFALNELIVPLLHPKPPTINGEQFKRITAQEIYDILQSWRVDSSKVTPPREDSDQGSSPTA